MVESNNKEFYEIFARYFNRLLNCNGLQERVEIKRPKATLPNSKLLDEHKMIRIIQWLKNNKATVEDDTVAEVRLGSIEVSTSLTVI